MDLPGPLLPGTLRARYKRFFADVELDTGESVTAHCPNPGSMMGLKEPGLRAFVSYTDDPKRKLKYTLQVLEADGGPVGINTNLPNKLAEEAIGAGRISQLSGYASLRREVKYGKTSRIDLLLESGADPRPCYVEVKNVHLMRTPGLAEFPDSVTARGAKHLEELGDQVEAGARAVMLYVVQRTDCDRLSMASDIDPAYAAALKRALERGVEAIAYGCDVTLEHAGGGFAGAITLTRPVALEI